MRAISTPAVIAVAVASLLSLGGTAWAASPDWKKSEDRARAHIKSF